MELRYDYPDYKRMIEEQGKIFYGCRYKIQPVDDPPLHRMITYFIQDVEEARKENLHLGKGLMLCGRIGCGKTALMQIFAAMSGGEFAPQVVSTRQIVMDFNSKGHETIRKYSDRAFNPQTSLPIVYCFDGLGSERDGHYFGEVCNVMAEILIIRSEMSSPNRIITHATTQLDAEALEKKYGKNVRSCMRGMFNLIHFDPESPDKRY
ncbi:AAA family ATPase [Chitinophaga barathri]|nr:AAA family ATPase [Chitinophaga barathri]